MGRILSVFFLSLGGLSLSGDGLPSQPPPPASDRTPPAREVRGGGPRPRRPGLGSVLPPFVRERLKLTEEQRKEIADLEADVKARLTKILTAEQCKQVEEILRKGPPDRPGRQPGGSEEGAPPEDGQPPRPPHEPEEGPAVNAGPATGGIQWFATLKRGLADARRSGRPILFVAAAPHCGGVPGIW